MASVVGDDDHKRFLIEVYEQISVSNIRQIFYLKRKRKKTRILFFVKGKKTAPLPCYKYYMREHFTTLFLSFDPHSRSKLNSISKVGKIPTCNKHPNDANNRNNNKNNRDAKSVLWKKLEMSRWSFWLKYSERGANVTHNGLLSHFWYYG